MEPIPIKELVKPDGENFYLPMHGVVKDHSTMTKLRVVFDASAKSSNGQSLNDQLLSGPPILTNVLIHFRIFKIGMSADIGKMFREISLHPSDRDYHHFVTTTEEGDIRDMRMTRLTFRVTSSPLLVTQTLRKLADNYSSELPQAAQTVHTSFYVDDCLTGADSLEEAISLREGLNDLMSRGCMKLRKWRTSSAALRATIPDELLETESTLLITTPSSHHKALGVHWDTGRDTLHITTPQVDAGATTTK